jgi:hypothetical protein
MANITADIGTVNIKTQASATANITSVPAPIVPGGLYPMRTFAYGLPNYRIRDGWLVDVPKYDFQATANFELNGAAFSTRPAPSTLNLGAAARWIADDYNTSTRVWSPRTGTSNFTTNATYAPTKITLKYIVGNEAFGRTAVNFSADSRQHFWGNITELAVGDVPDVPDGEYTLIAVMQTKAQITNDTPFAGIWYPGTTPTGADTFAESVSGQHSDVALVGHYLGLGSNITLVSSDAKTNLVPNPSFRDYAGQLDWYQLHHCDSQ